VDGGRKNSERVFDGDRTTNLHAEEFATGAFCSLRLGATGDAVQPHAHAPPHH
jgi:hypothetical protein